MKILLLCWRDSTHPQGGGSERYLERVGEYLAAQGHEVIYRTAKHTDAPRRSRRNGVRYERAGGKFGVYLAAPLSIWRNRPDVVVDTQNGIPFSRGCLRANRLCCSPTTATRSSGRWRGR